MIFSVIIPTYNRAHIIGDTITSVLNQTLQDFEVIVVDDGSTDTTRETVASLNDARIRYYFKTNEERSVARNFGADKASGRFLIFMDSDDRMRPDHLRQINEYIGRHPAARFLFSGFRITDLSGKELHRYLPRGIFKKEKLVYGNHLGCSAVTVESKLFQKHRFHVHPDIILFEDWELWLRVISEETLHCLAAGSIEMINHGDRSVLRSSPEQLAIKAEYFLNHAAPGIRVIAGNSRAKRRLAMGLNSYVALHSSLGHHKKTALNYLLRSVMNDITILGKRRFYVTLRNILL